MGSILGLGEELGEVSREGMLQGVITTEPAGKRITYMVSSLSESSGSLLLEFGPQPPPPEVNQVASCRS